MLKSIRRCLKEDIIEFYNYKGRFLYTDSDPLSVAEFKADYLNARKACGGDAKFMKEYLNRLVGSEYMESPRTDARTRSLM